MTLQQYLDGFARRDWETADGGPIRLAMVGLGWWTRDRAIPAVSRSTYCETAVVVSGDRGAADDVAASVPTVTHGLTYDEFHDGAATDAYDAIYVATPNAVHLPYVRAASDLGKHVLCEKPMEASVERAERLVEAAAAGGIRLMVGYRMQTEPAVRRARELLDDGAIGEPVHVHGHMTQPLLRLIPDHDQWRLDPQLAGPGTSVTDLGIYPINTARFVLGADPVAVSATMRSSAEAFDRVPDERATFEITFEDGVLAACSASQGAHRSGRFEVIGTDGRLSIDPAFFDDDRRTLVVERAETTAEIDFDPVDQMTEEFDYFADRLLTGAEIGPDGAHGLVDLRVIEAIYDAAASDRRVVL